MVLWWHWHFLVICDVIVIFHFNLCCICVLFLLFTIFCFSCRCFLLSKLFSVSYFYHIFAQSLSLSLTNNVWRLIVFAPFLLLLLLIIITNMKQARPWMVENLKIIWQSHAHPVNQKVSRFFGPRYIGHDFLLGPNLVTCNRTVVLYEISKVNFRVETKILVSMPEEV